MTNLNVAPSDAGFFGTEHRAAAGRTGLGRAWANYRTYRETLGALRALSERQLGDTGMRRDAVKSIARAAVYGN